MTKSKNDSVNQYMDALQIDFKDRFLAIRDVILKTEPELTEDIKWKNCLTYAMDKKNLIQTVVGKDKISLIFHNGAAIADDTGWLEGEGNKTRTARITSDDFDTARLSELVRKSVKIQKGK